MAFRLVLVLLLVAGPGLGQTSLELALEGFEDGPASVRPDDIDDILDDFDAEPTPGPTEPDASGVLPAWLRLGATLEERMVFNVAHDAPQSGDVDHRGLSSLRSRLDVEADVELGRDWRGRATGHAWFDLAFHANGRRSYPRGFLDAYEREAELGELFVQGSLGENIDVTLGRQVVIWGRSDLFRVTDVLNPLDNRLPGMTDIEDLRLPVAMARLDVYAGQWNASMIAVPERRFDKGPVPGSDFFPGQSSAPPQDDPDNAFGSPEVAVALTGTFPSWDISFYAANVFDDRPHVVETGTGPRLRRNRMWMVGSAGNYVSGNWLLKVEVAGFAGLRFTNAAGRKFSRLAALIGLEYSGLAETAIAFEAVNRHIFDYDSRLAAMPDDRRRNEPATALRISRSMRNDTIEVSFLALNLGLTGENGAIQRLQAVYNLTDSVDLTAGLVLYKSGDQAPFREIGDNDRLFFALDYYF